MRLQNWCLLLLIGISGISCDEEKKPTKTIIPDQFDQAAYEYLETFLKVSPATIKNLSTSLRPTDKDIESVFQDTTAQRQVKEYITKRFDDEKFAIVLRKEHTVLKVSSATIQDFLQNKPAALTFPSDFIDVVPLIYEDLTFHRFKFVATGNKVGAAYDGLTKVNDHWVLFPKIWKAFE